MYFYGYRQHQPHAFVNKLKKTKYITSKLVLQYLFNLPGNIIERLQRIQNQSARRPLLKRLPRHNHITTV